MGVKNESQLCDLKCERRQGHETVEDIIRTYDIEASETLMRGRTNSSWYFTICSLHLRNRISNMDSFSPVGGIVNS